jgi:hypothetical protein
MIDCLLCFQNLGIRDQGFVGCHNMRPATCILTSINDNYSFCYTACPRGSGSEPERYGIGYEA